MAESTCSLCVRVREGADRARDCRACRRRRCNVKQRSAPGDDDQDQQLLGHCTAHGQTIPLQAGPTHQGQTRRRSVTEHCLQNLHVYS